MKSKIQPIGDRVLVQLDKPMSKTPSGIIIPDVAKEKPKTGKVIALGTGNIVNGQLVPFSVELGDTVLFTKYSTEQLPDTEDLVMVRDSELLAKVVK